MPRFQRTSGGHIAADVVTHNPGEVAKYRRLVEDRVDGWREIDAPTEVKPLTPKQALQADAEALGLDTDGTVTEITARIDAKVADLLKQAGELGIDDDELTAVELAAAVDAKLAE